MIFAPHSFDSECMPPSFRTGHTQSNLSENSLESELWWVIRKAISQRISQRAIFGEVGGRLRRLDSLIASAGR